MRLGRMKNMVKAMCLNENILQFRTEKVYSSRTKMTIGKARTHKVQRRVMDSQIQGPEEMTPHL
jgi:hypothetical protein